MLQWWYFSGFISDYAYESKLHNNFHCLHQKPHQLMRVKKFSKLKKKLVKMTATVSALDQYLHLKKTFGIY